VVQEIVRFLYPVIALFLTGTEHEEVFCQSHLSLYDKWQKRKNRVNNAITAATTTVITALKRQQ
jgi:hypothetical protein